MNQAIFAWSFRQLDEEQGTNLNVKSKISSLIKANFIKEKLSRGLPLGFCWAHKFADLVVSSDLGFGLGLINWLS